MNIVLFPYKMGSKSAALLAKELECKRVFGDKDYKPKPDDIIINWGAGYKPVWSSYVKRHQMVNHWDDIAKAVDKSASFKAFDDYGIRIPEVTSKASKAMGWLEDGEFVVGRQNLEGKDGDGIILMKNPEDFQACQMYTKYIKKITEYRVYVCDGKVFDCLEKRRDSDRLAAGTVDQFIRTEKNGWVFCRQHVTMPEQVGKQAIKAVKALGLVHGGVDVGWNPQHNQADVFEVNTASSIFGPTIEKYAQALTQYIESQ